MRILKEIINCLKTIFDIAQDNIFCTSYLPRMHMLLYNSKLTLHVQVPSVKIDFSCISF